MQHWIAGQRATHSYQKSNSRVGDFGEGQQLAHDFFTLMEAYYGAVSDCPSNQACLTSPSLAANPLDKGNKPSGVVGLALISRTLPGYEETKNRFARVFPTDWKVDGVEISVTARYLQANDDPDAISLPLATFPT